MMCCIFLAALCLADSYPLEGVYKGSGTFTHLFGTNKFQLEAVIYQGDRIDLSISGDVEMACKNQIITPIKSTGRKMMYRLDTNNKENTCAKAKSDHGSFSDLTHDTQKNTIGVTVSKRGYQVPVTLKADRGTKKDSQDKDEEL
eukprot:GEMP01097193.1.p1 GENE.GEMP01097193.1~~GEMP01097193.1.p1  ORF type:complete len:144 (+),score=33.03 GEMP01097193.1:39-470(+)